MDNIGIEILLSHGDAERVLWDLKKYRSKAKKLGRIPDSLLLGWVKIFKDIEEERRNTAGYGYFSLSGSEEEFNVLIQFLETNLYSDEEIYGDTELAKRFKTKLAEAKNPQSSKPASFSTPQSSSQQQNIIRNNRSKQSSDEPPDDNDDWSGPSLYQLSNGKLTTDYDIYQENQHFGGAESDPDY